MTATVKIRQMKLEDIVEVYKLGKASFITEKAMDKSYVYNYWTLTAVAQMVEESLDLAFIATLNNKIVGFVLGHHGYEHIKDVGYLEWIAVTKQARRRGVALKLIERILSIFKKQGYLKIVTDIQKGNEESLNLFQKKFKFEIVEAVNFLEMELK